MNILFIGDPHLKITRFDLAKQFLIWINEVIAENKPDLVINLGDTFDTHAVLRSEILGEFQRHIRYVCGDLSIPYFYVLGNHDFYKPTSSDYHALMTFANQGGFKIIDKIYEFDNITIVPYLVDHTQFPKKTREICVAHQTFIGADYGYHRPEVGVDAGAVSAEIIISGHIHLRQEFGKVIYPGTPYAQSVNDIDQCKGVLLFDTKTYNKKFIESPLPKWRGARYELTPSFSIKDLHESISDTVDSDDHWVIELTGPRAEILSYLSSKDHRSLCKGKDIKVKPVFTDKKKQRTKIEAKSIEHIASEFVNKVYKGSLDKKDLVSKSLEILNNIRQTESKAKM